MSARAILAMVGAVIGWSAPALAHDVPYLYDPVIHPTEVFECDTRGTRGPYADNEQSTAALVLDPSLQGRLIVVFVLGPGGGVEST